MSPQAPENVATIQDWSKLLDGKVAVVTGGGAGIGGAISKLFAAHGAVVEMAEIDEETANSTRREIEDAGGVTNVHIVDVTQPNDVARLRTGVLDRHGQVDVLINNVGEFRPLVRFEESNPESWNAMYTVNLLHVFAVTRAFLDAMTTKRSGSIVNLHSVEGLRGYPRDPVYGAMKAAVAHFTTCLAVDVGRHGIRVNGIGPDLTQTPQVDYLTGSEDHDHLWSAWAPLGRLGWPEDQARVALFLASDLSGYITGHNIPVDGGTKAGGGWYFAPSEGRFVNRPKGL
jgi:NAD(P)-dependent dehydrogenase (short-subunit alcohol dehydrogenase family)